jgi:hypothetical protein
MVKEKQDSWIVRHQYDVLVAIATVAILFVLFSQVKIEYIEEIPYQTEKRVVILEDYVAGKEPILKQEEYKVRVYFDDVESFTPTTLTSYRECEYKDLDYVILYTDGLQKPYDIRTETGYKRNKGSPMGEYHQLIMICNEDKPALGGVFNICHYSNGNLVNCPGKYTIKEGSKGVSAGSKASLNYREFTQCSVDEFRWRTAYDETKNITLMPVQVSQKRVCETKTEESPAELYKSHRFLGKESTRNVVNFKEETRFRNVTVGYEDIIKTREKESIIKEDKIRYDTKHRSLWQELLIKLGL